jgi:hypothetical protein
VVLEPHMQNVLIGVDHDSWPAQVLFRDLEGTKLVSSRHAALLAGLPPGVARGLAYDTKRGWDRVAYCLLVNHLAEVAAAIADRSPAAAACERELWRQARHVLSEAAAEHGWPPGLRAVLAGCRCRPRPTCGCAGPATPTGTRGTSRSRIPSVSWNRASWSRAAWNRPRWNRASWNPRDRAGAGRRAGPQAGAGRGARLRLRPDRAGRPRGRDQGRAPRGVQFYYAVKANPDAAVLRTLARHADGFEVSSGGELTHTAPAAPGRPPSPPTAAGT